MADTTDVLKPPPDPRDLRVVELETQLRQRDARIEQLQQRIAELEQQLAELKRAAKRQATPFARKRRKEKPQRPGRKAGQGPFTARARPTPDQVTETKEQALDACPTCGGPVTDVKDHEQFVVDIPEVQPIVTRYVTHSGQCARCGRRVRARHPEQISDATGSAGVVIGPRAKALAADLKHRLGVPYGKVAEVLEVGFGLPVSRGGLCQADARLAKQAQPVYAELIDLIRQSAMAHADETGWRIGTLAAWLWVFTNRALTVYTIAPSRGHEVVVQMLGEAFAGVLVSDCFTAYDHQALEAWLKQKCIGHLLQDLRALNESKTGGAVRFARDVTAMLRAALHLRDQKPTLAPADFAAQAAHLEAQLDALIDARRQLTDADNLRFAKRLRKHRPHLLRFLYVDGLDATNNQAERMLRPACHHPQDRRLQSHPGRRRDAFHFGQYLDHLSSTGLLHPGCAGQNPAERGAHAQGLSPAPAGYILTLNKYHGSIPSRPLRSSQNNTSERRNRAFRRIWLKPRLQSRFLSASSKN